LSILDKASNWGFETKCRAPKRLKTLRGCVAWMRRKARRRAGGSKQDVCDRKPNPHISNRNSLPNNDLRDSVLQKFIRKNIFLHFHFFVWVFRYQYWQCISINYQVCLKNIQIFLFLPIGISKSIPYLFVEMTESQRRYFFKKVILRLFLRVRC
jgi:hypothetical protein